MPFTTYLGVELMEAGQSQPHIVHNSAIVNIDKAVAGRFAKDMTGLTTYTLTGAESTNHQINVYGTPSAAITITVQNVAKTWVFVNDTAQQATFKTAAGTGVIVPPASHAHLFSDGANVHGEFTRLSPLAGANQAAVTQTAGASYTATEQAMLGALKTLTNQLRSDLVAAGVIKGSA